MNFNDKLQNQKQGIVEDFKNSYSEIAIGINKTFSEILKCKKLKYTIIKEMINNFVDFIEDASVIPLINTIDDMVGYMKIHSLSTGALCLIVGTKLGYNKEDIKILTLAGLLHDIGKLQTPKSILMSPGKLTDEEFILIKEHPKHGFELLSKYTDLDSRVKLAALQHHSRSDESGYPEYVNYKEIGEFSKIVTNCDIFEAITATRPYKKEMCPFWALGEIYRDGLLKGDSNISRQFVDNISTTYLGAEIEIKKNFGKIIGIFTTKNNQVLPVIQDNNFKVSVLS